MQLSEVVQRRFARWVAASDDARLERVVGSRAGLRTVFGAMARAFDPAGAQGFVGDLQFDLRGRAGVRRWTVACGAASATARPGGSPSPAVVVKLSVADFVRLAAGELDPGRALLSGQLDLEGDFAVATRLGAMFGRPD